MQIAMPVPVAIQYLTDRHHFWYDHLAKWYERSGLKTPPPIPELVLNTRPIRRAGRFSVKAHRCEYTLIYCVVHGEKNDETVAHEMCHAFQQYAMPGCEWHGEFFFFLLRVVCGFKTATKYHDMKPKELQLIGKLVHLHLRANPNVLCREIDELQEQDVHQGRKD